MRSIQHDGIMLVAESEDLQGNEWVVKEEKETCTPE
jgi:hypothetical protein